MAGPIDDAHRAIHQAQKTIRAARPKKPKPEDFPDFSDVIHTEPRTWGGPNPAPSRRPWRGTGLGDDDDSGMSGGMTNRQWEDYLEQIRAAGQVINLRNRLGELRHPGSYRENLGGGMVGYNSEQDADGRRMNKSIRQREKAEHLLMYPQGCSCIRCQAKRQQQLDRRTQELLGQQAHGCLLHRRRQFV